MSKPHQHRWQFPFVDVGEWRIASDQAVCKWCGAYRPMRLRQTHPLVPAKLLNDR